jgi:hypothetical protein
MVIVISNWLVSQFFLPFEFYGISSSGGLSPSVIMVEEHVIQMEKIHRGSGKEVHMRWNIVDFLNYSWSNFIYGMDM